MQCPVCGREVAELLEGFCPSCLVERRSLWQVPEVVDATECAHCGRLHGGASWRPASSDRSARAEGVLRLAIELDPRLEAPQIALATDPEDDKNLRIGVHLDAAVRGVHLVRDAESRVRFKTGVCPDCSREMGGYFEATLQVRGSPGTDLEHLLPEIDDHLIRRMDTLRDENRPNSFFTEVRKTKHGHDYILGSNEAARQLAEELADKYGAEQDESTKLFSRKDGRDVLRWTHLVRLPPYAKGDFLLVDDVPCKLLSFDRRILLLLDLNRRVRIRKEVRRIASLRVIGRARDELSAVIVSRGGGYLQVLDPITLRTVDLPDPGIPSDASSMAVFRHEDALYPVLEAST